MRWAGPVLACAVLALPWAARAQVDDTAMALSLFEEGRKLSSEGNYAEACPKLLASHRLVQKVGTLLNLADCYEKNGQTASAWARFSEATGLAERAGDSDRVEFAKTHLAALAPKLCRLTITSLERARGLEVKRDGTVVNAAGFGLAFPVDPGPHAIEAIAPGKKPWSKSVRVEGEGSSVTVEVPKLEDAPVEKPAAPTPVITQVIHLEERDPGGPYRGWGVASMIVGTLLIASGGFGASLAKARYDESLRGCLPNDVCTSEALRNRNDADGFANFSTAGFVAGVALVSLGVTLFIVAPKKKTAEIKAAIGPSGAALEGAW